MGEKNDGDQIASAVDRLISRSVLISILLATHYGKVLEKLYTITATPSADPTENALLLTWLGGSVVLTAIYLGWTKLESI